MESRRSEKMLGLAKIDFFGKFLSTRHWIIYFLSFTHLPANLMFKVLSNCDHCFAPQTWIFLHSDHVWEVLAHIKISEELEMKTKVIPTEILSSVDRNACICTGFKQVIKGVKSEYWFPKKITNSYFMTYKFIKVSSQLSFPACS